MPNAKTPVANPPNDIECIALVRPGSKLARSWSLSKPTFGIYDYSKARGRHRIRFGDGSCHELISAMFPDILLLHSEGSELVDQLF